jgi:hypothetical protein
MRFSTLILLPLLAILSTGCVTARYHYTIAVPGADSATPATVELSWKGGSRTFTLNSPNCASARLSEVMQPVLCPVADVPRGLEVRVTREGYKPWQAIYSHVDEDFRSKRWDTFYRWDVVQLEPVSNDKNSRAVDGTAIYR